MVSVPWSLSHEERSRMKKSNGDEYKTSGECLWYIRTHSDKKPYVFTHSGMQGESKSGYDDTGQRKQTIL